MAQREHGAKPGDLIEFFRPAYQHWGVYIGKDEVVHLTSPDDQGSSSSGYIFSFSSSGSPLSFSSSGGVAVVKCENIWKVAANCYFKVNNYRDGKYNPRDPRVIVKEAREMVGKRLPYSVTSANCEHFVTELRYGKAWSRQVAKFKTAVAAAVAAAVVAAPTAAAAVAAVAAVAAAGAGVGLLRNIVAAAPEPSEESIYQE